MDMTGGASKWFRPPTMTNAQETTFIGTLVAGDAGKMWYNSSSNQWKGWNGAGVSILG